MRKVCFRNNLSFRPGLFVVTLTFENGIMWEDEKIVFRWVIEKLG